ncbi:MAG: hypothetical protein WBQ23_14190 [Bacteroidota bacterium]
MKRILLGTLAVFVAWQIIDFVLHSIILMKAYEETSSIWRPMEEMKWISMYISSLISAFLFAAIYGWLVKPKTLKNALIYGLLFGLGAGTAMGYGTYAVIPIPYSMAFTWFIGTTVECVVAGLLLAFIVKEDAVA